ncbi:MAG TPA: SH3 domain-containing protein [Symbiobacteriaceae bacterium]|jgi:hypothetical protein|nr:SH3 domain-containing protein [Symbiobacteriaceae bacterium]
MGIAYALSIPLWHPSGKLLQLSLYMRGGHDDNCELKLQVQNTGDCLNVRTEPNRAGHSIGCFKDGTVLTVAPGASDHSTIIWSEDGPWAHVRTPDGKIGLVSLKDGYLGWAK